jgi:hypothetical protein
MKPNQFMMMMMMMMLMMVMIMLLLLMMLINLDSVRMERQEEVLCLRPV